jgi:hypothetical protein
MFLSSSYRVIVTTITTTLRAADTVTEVTVTPRRQIHRVLSLLSPLLRLSLRRHRPLTARRVWSEEGETEREREREREKRQTDRQTDRQTNRQTDRQTDEAREEKEREK